MTKATVQRSGGNTSPLHQVTARVSIEAQLPRSAGQHEDPETTMQPETAQQENAVDQLRKSDRAGSWTRE